MFNDICVFMHRINWADLQFVNAVAVHGSLAAAGRALGVNHATVLRRIDAFEKRHDVRLFQRTSSGYRLLPESAEMLNAIQSIEETIDGVERSLAGFVETLTGSLRLTSTDSFAGSILPRQLSLFRAAFPGVIPRVMISNSRMDLARLDAEIAIRPAHSLPADLTGENAGELIFRVYEPAGMAYDPDQGVYDGAWVGVGEELDRSPVATWEASKLKPGAVVLRMNSFVAMARAAAGGLGRAMLPSCTGDVTPGLVRAACPDQLTTSVWVAAHRDLAASPRIAAFIAQFSRTMRLEQAVLRGETPPPLAPD